MSELNMCRKTIDKVKKEIVELVSNRMSETIDSIILYGSCARGDYEEDSDMDIALIVKCNREETQKYLDIMADIATEMAIKYFTIVNFTCLPIEEYMQKKQWYPYFRNIDREGEVLYGTRLLSDVG